MALSVRELGRAFNAGATSVNVSTGDVADGDLLFACGDADTNLGGLTAPAGWTQVTTGQEDANGVKVWVKDALADNEPASYTFGTQSGSDGAILLFAATATAGTPTFDQAAITPATTGTALVAPSVTASEATAVLVCSFTLFSGTSSGRSITLPGSMTALLENVRSNGWHHRSVAFELVGADATGTRAGSASHVHPRFSVSLAISEVGGAEAHEGSGEAAGLTQTPGEGAGTPAVGGAGEQAGTVLTPGAGAGAPAVAGAGEPAGLTPTAAAGAGTPAPAGAGTASGAVLVPQPGSGTAAVAGVGVGTGVVATPGTGSGSPAVAGVGDAAGLTLTSSAGAGLPTVAGSGAAAGLLLTSGAGSGSPGAGHHSGAGLPAGMLLTPSPGAGTPAAVGAGVTAGMVLAPGVGGPSPVDPAPPEQTFQVAAQRRRWVVAATARTAEVRPEPRHRPVAPQPRTRPVAAQSRVWEAHP